MGRKGEGVELPSPYFWLRHCEHTAHCFMHCSRTVTKTYKK